MVLVFGFVIWCYVLGFWSSEFGILIFLFFAWDLEFVILAFGILLFGSSSMGFSFGIYNFVFLGLECCSLRFLF